MLPPHYRHLIEKFERSQVERTAGAAFDSGWNKADRLTGWHELNLSAHPERWEREIATFTTVVDRVAKEYQRLVGHTLPQVYRLGPLRMKKYEAAQGHRFAPHTDANSMRDAPRFLSLLFYLNTVTEGRRDRIPEPGSGGAAEGGLGDGVSAVPDVPSRRPHAAFERQSTSWERASITPRLVHRRKAEFHPGRPWSTSKRRAADARLTASNRPWGYG